MLLVGSVALLKSHPNLNRRPKDIDFICEYEAYETWYSQNKADVAENVLMSSTSIVCHLHTGRILEFNIAWPGNTNEDILEYCKGQAFADPNVLLMLKLSHRYRRNSPHFHKTMRDINFLRKHGAKLDARLAEILKKREVETYDYSHPNLNQPKQNFFDASVPYTYEHDDIHEAVAVGDRPAYTTFQKDGAEVKSSKKKFFAQPIETRLHAGLEESYVLAIERSLVPHGTLTPQQAFDKALEKVCTSITSGWFREFCYDNYHQIRALYSEDYYQKFKDALAAGKIRPAQTFEYQT